jgi:hypothetical protein
MEQFYIYKFDKEGLTTNEQHTNQSNIFFWLTPKKKT